MGWLWIFSSPTTAGDQPIKLLTLILPISKIRNVGRLIMNSYGIQHPEIDGAACLPYRAIGCSPFMSNVFNE